LTRSSSSTALRFFAKLQQAIANISYPSESRLEKLNILCGVDGAYRKGLAAAAAVVYDIENDRVVESRVKTFREKPSPYIPGFLVLREGPFLVDILSEVTSSFDVVVVDGHGRAHPRRCGLATFLGFVTGHPTVGVAKSLLVGKLREAGEMYEIICDGEVVGLSKGSVYFSQGYGVSFDDLKKLVKVVDGKYPKALRLSDHLSRKALEERG